MINLYMQLTSHFAKYDIMPYNMEIVSLRNIDVTLLHPGYVYAAKLVTAKITRHSQVSECFIGFITEIQIRASEFLL